MNIQWTVAAAWAAASFLISFAAIRLAAAVALRPLHRHSDTSWPQVARFTYPARVAVSIAIFLPLMFTFCGILFYEEAAPGMPEQSARWMGGVGSALGGLLAYLAVSRRAWFKNVPRRDVLAGMAVAALALLPNLVVVLIGMALMPAQFGVVAWTITGLCVVVMLGLAFGGNLLLLRLLGVARPASPRLQGILERATELTRVRPRGADELRWPLANALAFILPRRIAVSDTAMRELSDEQLVAVCVHELAHLSEPLSVVVRRVLSTFMWLPLVLVAPLMSAGLGALFLGYYAVFIGVLLLSKRMRRRMEERADSLAHASEVTAGVYATALARLYEVNLMPAVMASKRTVHPHLYDRLLAAGCQPDFPRPGPPSRLRTTAAVAVGMTFAIAGAFATLVLMR